MMSTSVARSEGRRVVVKPMARSIPKRDDDHDDILVTAAHLIAKSTSTEQAVSRLLKVIENDPALCAKANQMAACHWINIARHSARALVTSEEIGGAFSLEASPYAKCRVAALSLFSIRLPGLPDKALGDATVHDLSAVKDRYLGIAHVSKARGEAYQRLEEALAKSGKSTVRAAFSESRVKKIMGTAL